MTTTTTRTRLLLTSVCKPIGPCVGDSESVGYELLHGQAVGLGLIAECAMAQRAGLLESGTDQRLSALLSRLGLPVRVPFRTNAERVRHAMMRDKKNVAGEIRFAVPLETGRMGPRNGAWTVGLDEATIDAGLASIL
jgi:3-dehydroquinate synthase